jgi:HlyD family secretion protein
MSGHSSARRWVIAGLVVASAAVFHVVTRPRGGALPAGITMTNGRLEATEIDVATRLAGRVSRVLVAEGDTVEAGAVVATIDTGTLAAQLREAEAQVRRARHAITTAHAVVAQRENELALAQRDLVRTEDLASHGKGMVAEQKIDADRARVQNATAALAAARSLGVETEAALEAAEATVERVRADIEDCVLRAPRAGRVQYRLAEMGEVLGPGGKVVTVLDTDDVYMTIFLPEATAGQLAIGSEARIVLDAAPDYVLPARVSFVSAEAQFTPKAVETAHERQKLAFRVKLHLDPELLRRYRSHAKVGIPGIAYVRTRSSVPWPETLTVRRPAP